MRPKYLLIILAALLLPAGMSAQDSIPDDFISFSVPGHEEEMDLIRGIYYEAYMNPVAKPGPAFWDPWTPVPLMCVAPIKADMEALWKNAYLERRITEEGYVSCNQHYSHALDDGWPFPLFPQVNGGFEGCTFGYIFQDGPDKLRGMLSYFKDELDAKGYIGERAVSRLTVNDFLSEGIVDDAWQMTATGDLPSIETEDGFKIDAFNCPFINFRTGLDTEEHLQGILEWQCEGDEGYSKSRSITFSLQQDDPFSGSDIRYCTIEPSRLDSWKGTITKLRISFPGAKGVRFRIDSFFSAFNTRHQMNACNFLMGSIHTFNQTGDLDYLRQNIGRMRKVLDYAQRELYDRKARMIRVRYQGHDGLPGFHTDKDGNRTYYPGHSIGGNYWDILPFGNLETYTSYYYVYTLRAMADLEEFIRKEQPSGIPSGGFRIRPGKLRREAGRIVKTLNDRMWNKDKGRFYGSEDIEGKKWDYGFVFLNQEAIYYGAATPEHAREIMDWIDGRRIIEGETSTGKDIYHWRLAPRTTTIRNEDWYYWAWDPQVFPFGRQVQDGGAVFSQSFNDMMSRIQVYGPDSAWERFQGILDWYKETREAGGYRAYYADGSHGNSMQGNGTAGGIGIDLEFAETLLVPYTMIEGFLGFKATSEGYTIHPNLPSDWESLTVDNLYFRGQRLSVTVDANNVNVKVIE